MQSNSAAFPKNADLFVEFLRQNPAAKFLSDNVTKQQSAPQLETMAFLAYSFQIWMLERTLREENDANRRMSDNMLKMIGDDLSGFGPED